MGDVKPKSLKSADAADMLGDEATCIPMSWTSLGGKRVFEGLVSTIRCNESVGIIKQAISEPGEGRVLVIDGSGSTHRAIVGDRMAKLAADNGWSGLIVHGAARDADELASINIGLFALITAPARGSFDIAGERDVPLQINGYEVKPNTYAFCDSDGVVICSKEAAEKLNRN